MRAPSLGVQTVRMAALAAASLLAASLVTPPPSSAQTAGLTGEPPVEGGVALAVWSGGPTADLAAELDADGCYRPSAWVTRDDGGFTGYIVGAPAFANAGWFERFPGGELPSALPLVIVCQQPPDGGATPAPDSAAQLSFEHHVIDTNNPNDPMVKTLADIDGDGQLDAIAGSADGEGLFWYEYPAWTKRPIRASGSWSTDMQAGDVDGDGDPDIVVPRTGGDASTVVWYENPRPTSNPSTATWEEHIIGAAAAHDVEVADIDRDGDLDVVTRSQSSGAILWLQESPDSWRRIQLPAEMGEGTGIGDVDGDGDIDVAFDGIWAEQRTPTSWVEHNVASASWPSRVAVRVADVNRDGRADIVIAPSESEGRFAWYEQRATSWVQHVIDENVAYFHTFAVVDMNGDGRLDLVTAEMHQSPNPDSVAIYFNPASGDSWGRFEIATTGSHNIRVGDVDGDGDLDIFGANWNDNAPNSAVIEWWENTGG